MKKIIGGLFSAAIVVLTSLQTHAQGLVYDQESATGPLLFNNPIVDFFNLQEDSPLMQSFIPTISAIGFAQFEFIDTPNNGTNGATVYVNLWTGSPDINSATFLGSTTPVYMPNGFGFGYGVTNFYFSTPVTLTAGQTYYLQPVVLSGDDPWGFMVLGNTNNAYSGGSLFERGIDIGIDSWFREGTVSVPEPAVLALFGLSSLLIFGLKRHSNLVVLLFAIPVLSVHAASDSIVQVTADAAGLTPVSGAILPSEGTFWIMKTSSDGDLIGPPYPFLPPGLSAMPIYLVTNSIFIVDDTSGQLMPASAGRLSSAQAAATMQAQSETVAALIVRLLNPPAAGEFHRDGFSPMFDTNGVWLSIAPITNGISQIVIHEPDSDLATNWNLFYTTNVATPFTNWWWILTTDIGQTNLIVPNATDAQGFYI
jgi:hypothetical protein